jgi:hypothetical protein
MPSNSRSSSFSILAAFETRGFIGAFLELTLILGSLVQAADHFGGPVGML